MPYRTCRPSVDLKQIWQLLLPDMPFPACAVAADTEKVAREKNALLMEPRDDAEARRNFPRQRHGR